MVKGKVKIAVLAFSTLLMGASIVTGIIADIAKQFPDAGQSTITLVLTLPFLVATLFALAAGPLSGFISKKSLVIFSHFAILAGCLVAYFFGGMSINMLLLASVLFGVSQGTLSTLSMALIADHYEGHARGALMGLQSTFVTFGGMVLTFAGAMLAGVYWQNTYLVLLVALPSMILVLKYLPKDTPQASSKNQGSFRDAMTAPAFFYIFAGLFYGIFMFTLQANLAFYIAGEGLGGAATAGYANSAIVAVGGITGIFYGRLSQILKQYVMPVGLIVSAAGGLYLYLVGDIASVFIACACMGYGLTSTIPTIMFKASVVVPPASATMAIALINTATSVGIFTSPFIIGAVLNFAGNDDIRTKFLTGAMGLAGLALIYIIGDAAVSRSSVQDAPEPAIENA